MPYGIRGIPNPDNTSGGRSAAASWIDDSGALWFFGGAGAVPIYMSEFYYNDLWKLNLTGTMTTHTLTITTVGKGTNGEYKAVGEADVLNMVKPLFKDLTRLSRN